MDLSRRNLMQWPAVLAGFSSLGLGAATAAFAERATIGVGEVIDLWPHPPEGVLHPAMAPVIEQTSSDPAAYSSRRMKGIARPYMIALPAAD